MRKFPWLKLFLVIGAVLFIDQLTKSVMQNVLADGSVQVLGPIRFSLVYNDGIAFGLASGYAPVLVAVAILVIVFVLIRQRTQVKGAALIAVGLVIGGAIGNLADRLFRGHGGAVVDFVDIWRWPVFNVADAAVVVGALVLAFVGARQPEAIESTPSKEQS